MKSCFVIMPYGGASEEKRKHYLGVYQSIIIPAVTRAGYEASRSDITREPGNITHQIIRSLLESDIVIADLTDANANVFFELGIRHAFRKSGTIHIVDESHPIPFDIGHYRAIKYSDNFASLPTVIDEIVHAIAVRESQIGRPDNPVHDAIATLPIDIRDIGLQDLQNQIQKLQENNDKLTKELEDALTTINQIDPAKTFKGDGGDIVDAILDEAESVMRQTGQHVIYSLATKADEGGAAAVVNELRSVLKSPYLAHNDFLEISNICTRLGLREHRRAVLEIAHQRYPRTTEIVFLLAAAYDDSPNLVQKEKGRIILEKFLDGKPVLTRALPAQETARGLGVLADFYTELGKPEWILALMESSEEIMGESGVTSRWCEFW
jgi:Rad3-related DNA helicase